MYICRRLLSFLPSNNLEDPPRLQYEFPMEDDESLNGIVPVERKQAYDVREILTRILDHNDFMEVQPGFAPNIVIGFGRIQGRSIGIIANQPNVLAGALDINASDKAARFIRFLNAFNIPIVTFCGRSGLFAGSATGVRRDHPPRREDAVCVFGGDQPEDHGCSAQSLRRRVSWRCAPRIWERTGCWPGQRRKLR